MDTIQTLQEEATRRIGTRGTRRLQIDMAVPFGTSTRPIILGIVGDSAAGKTTLSRGIVQILGPEDVSVLCTDDYHRYNREQRKALGITPLNPACNYLDVMAQHLQLLRAGEPILKPHYEHKRGDFGPPQSSKVCSACTGRRCATPTVCVFFSIHPRS